MTGDTAGNRLPANSLAGWAHPAVIKLATLVIAVIVDITIAGFNP